MILIRYALFGARREWEGGGLRESVCVVKGGEGTGGRKGVCVCVQRCVCFGSSVLESPFAVRIQNCESTASQSLMSDEYSARSVRLALLVAAKRS